MYVLGTNIMDVIYLEREGLDSRGKTQSEIKISFWIEKFNFFKMQMWKILSNYRYTS